MRVAASLTSLLIAGCAPSIAELASRGAWPEVAERSAVMSWGEPERACALAKLADALDASVILEPLWTNDGCDACAKDFQVPEAIFLVRFRHAPIVPNLRFGAFVSQGRQFDRGSQAVGDVTSRSELRAAMVRHADPSVAYERAGDDTRPPDSLGRAIVDVMTLGATRQVPKKNEGSTWDRMFDRVCATIGCEAAFERLAGCHASAARGEACSLLAVYPRAPALDARMSFSVTFPLPEGRSLQMHESVDLEGSTFTQAAATLGTHRLQHLQALGASPARCPVSGGASPRP